MKSASEGGGGFLWKIYLGGGIKEQNDIALLSDLTVLEHVVKNNKYEKRQSSVISSVPQSGSSAPPPCVRGFI